MVKNLIWLLLEILGGILGGALGAVTLTLLLGIFPSLSGSGFGSGIVLCISIPIGFIGGVWVGCFVVRRIKSQYKE